MAKIKLQFSLVCEWSDGRNIGNIINGFTPGMIDQFFIVNKWVWDEQVSGELSDQRSPDGYSQETQIVEITRKVGKSEVSRGSGAGKIKAEGDELNDEYRKSEASQGEDRMAREDKHLNKNWTKEAKEVGNDNKDHLKNVIGNKSNSKGSWRSGIDERKIIAYSQSDNFRVKNSHTHNNCFQKIAFSLDKSYRVIVKLFDSSGEVVESASMEYPLFVKK
jgi:hypothetical protein